MFTQKGSFIMKKSRTFRKSFVAAIAALCLAVPLAVMPVQVETSYADGTETATTTYKAYQIFKGTYADGSLGNIDWGDDVNTNGLIEAIKTLGGTFTNVGSAKDVAVALGSGTDTEIAKNFAKFIEDYIKDDADGTNVTANNSAAQVTSAGYYLVRTDKVAENDARTRFILQVTDGVINFSPKKTIPSVVKKVQENTEINSDHGNYENYKNYNDVADYNIGDSVPFLLEATLPLDMKEFDEYGAYYLRFNDTLSNGFTAPNPSDIKIFVDGKEVVYNVYNIHRDVTGNSIAITIENVKALTGTDVSVKAGSKIAVMYNATLNANATIGLDGNMNSVNLEYSNNPNAIYNPSTGGAKDDSEKDGNDENNTVDENETTPETPDVPDNNPDDNKDTSEDNTGKTEDDKVIVFTYELDVTKYKDSVSDGNEVIAGEVEFKLYRKVTENSAEVEQVALLDANNKITGWISATPTADNENPGTLVASEYGGIIKFIGLDDGTYTLKETKAPAGYNSVEIQVVITAETENGQTWNDFTPSGALKNLSVTADGEAGIGNVSDGKASIKVINQKGSSLPSTGGIGTTIFYLGGGTMAAVAGVYLITKKRMKNEEDDEI